MTQAEATFNEAADIGEENAGAPRWASDAPRGGRVVLNRVLKEAAVVPLFLGQTFIQSLRDVGYDSTTSALCEHVDNSIGAGASEVRVYFRQTGQRSGSLQTDVMVYDNGRGMAPNVLQVATSFGGSMSYGSRIGIGRFGMGMKTAALSLAPAVELYSWQEPAAIYRMILDTSAIGRDKQNLISLPAPEFMTEFGPDIAEFFTRPMGFPKTRSDQALLAESGDVRRSLPPTGTVIYMPDCDRLSYATAKSLVEHCTKEMARVYRRHINKGLKLFVNNRQVDAVDPTFSMPSARHAGIDGLVTRTSRLISVKKVPIARGHEQRSADIQLKLFALPIEEWSDLPRKVQKNDLGIFSGHNISVLRNDREVFAGYLPDIVKRHGDTNWFRLEIDFPGELDEAFGVAANKQGVRLQGHVVDAINKAIGDDVTSVRDEVKRVQAKRSTAKRANVPSESEQRATEADPFQPDALDDLTDQQREQMDENLRGLAVGLKREGETDEEAFSRVKQSKFLITYRHDEYWPFYHVESKFGRIILTINTVHPFFTELYEPLMKASVPDGDGEAVDVTAPAPKGPSVILELMLFSLARAQSVLGRENPEASKVFETLRRTWSETFRIQLSH